MTDQQVLAAVDRAKRAFKTAETKAQRRFYKEREEARNFFGSSDVEQAARHNAIHRAEAVLDNELSTARIRLIDALEDLRERAGEWADLVPRVR